jgi:hypothetical protein
VKDRLTRYLNFSFKTFQILNFFSDLEPKDLLRQVQYGRLLAPLEDTQRLPGEADSSRRPRRENRSGTCPLFLITLKINTFAIFMLD